MNLHQSAPKVCFQSQTGLDRDFPGAWRLVTRARSKVELRYSILQRSRSINHIWIAHGTSATTTVDSLILQINVHHRQRTKVIMSNITSPGNHFFQTVFNSSTSLGPNLQGIDTKGLVLNIVFSLALFASEILGFFLLKSSAIGRRIL